MPRVFLNPHSGPRGASQGDRVEARIRELLPDCSITPMRAGLDFKALAREDAPDLPWVAGGGDGTVNAIANAVCGTGRPMGVLGLGTLNHFARDLKLPLDLEAAAKVILGGHIEEIDAAEVNGRVFVNNSSLGAYPAMVMDRMRMQKTGRGKWLAMIAASVRAFFRFRCLQVEMHVNGESQTCTTPFLFVGNNEYCLDDSARLGQRPSLNRGVLALYLAPGATRSAVIRMAAAALFGRLKQTPEHQQHLVDSFTVRVHGRRLLRISLDGEVTRMPGPLCYRSLPGALHVLLPLQPSGEEPMGDPATAKDA